MPVELTILSGARQGEHLTLAGPLIRIGPASPCDLVFDPEADPGAAEAQAEIQWQVDQWQLVVYRGHRWLVNQQPVQATMPLQSGDIIRLSEDGPDLLAVLPPSSEPAPWRRPPACEPPQNGSPAFHEFPESSSHPESPYPSPPQAVPQDWHEPLPRSSPLAWSLVLLVVIFLALATWLGFRLRATRFDEKGIASKAPVVEISETTPRSSPTQPPDDPRSERPFENVAPAPGRAPQSSAPTTVKPAENPGPAVRPSPANPETAGSAANDSASPAAPPVGPTPVADAKSRVWNEIFQRVEQSVLLVGIEEPKGRSAWPFATACAVRPDTLLCSARAATELATFRRSGWRIWAGRPWQGKPADVLEIRVHRLFAQNVNDREKRLYFNTALLTIGGKVPHTAELASPEDLHDLANGMPIACVAIAHDGEALNRFQNLAPELVPGRVFLLTALSPDPDAPRLLHLQLPAPARILGSPVFNLKGKVIGVYSEAAAPAANETIQRLKIHYGTQVAPELVDPGSREHAGQAWVQPKLSESPAAARTKESTP